ncbi:MAG TPA: hypothetical protein VM370_05615 [Candidatus Thermoplasmatota archaeon]|nr:hypothetical protein [Candidatus Thermoplasmatota archaeon]
MRKLVALVLLSMLIAGCTKEGGDPTPTPSSSTPTTSPVFPTPSPTRPPTASPTPASPTPTAPSPSPTPSTPTPPAAPTVVNWSFTLSVGSATSVLPVPGAPDPSPETNCIKVPSAQILAGGANATWGGTTPLSGTSLDLIGQGTGFNASASGGAPLSIGIPAIPAGNETTILMQLTDPGVPTRLSVTLDVWLSVAGAAPAQPTVVTCPRA